MKSPEEGGSRTANTMTKESHITVLSLLKSFYDEQIFSVLIKDFYSSDLDISLTAIRSSASIGNEIAIPHLFRILEHGKPSQRIAAIQTLSAINAPSTLDQLVKYFNIFPNLEIRREILKAVNKISPLHPRVAELNKAVLMDPTKEQKLLGIIVEGLLEVGDLETVSANFHKISAETQRLVFTQLLQSSSKESSNFISSFQQKATQFDPHTLGCYLCAYELKTDNPQQNFILDTLQEADPRTTTSFLMSLSTYNGKIQFPTRLFRLLLRLPYIDLETEAVNGDFLIRIVQEVKTNSPLHLNEFIFTTATHLEAVFSKVNRQFLSLKNVTEKESLLMVVLAKTLERYATAELLQDTLRFFKSENIENPSILVEQLRTVLKGATPDEQNRFEACLPLFTATERKVRFVIYQTLAKINLSRHSLLRRINRLIRIIGTLEIRNSGKKILEILEFAREERISFLVETCVVTLCQLLNRTAIEQAKTIFQDTHKHLASIKGYIRGARFLPAKLFLNPMLQVLQDPALKTQVHNLVIDSLQQMDLQGTRGIMPPLLKVLKLPEIEADIKNSISSLLAKYGDSSLFQPLLDLSTSTDAYVRKTGIRTLRALVFKEANLPRDVLTNRLYLLLEDSMKSVQIEALMTLLALRDDYATQLLQDYIDAQDDATLCEFLRNLDKPVTTLVLSMLLRLLESGSAAVHEELRRLLPEFCQGNSAEEIRKQLLNALKGMSPQAAPSPASKTGEEKPVSLIEHAKLEFKFRRENAQNLTVFFIDIVSYTEKSSIVDTVSLMKLIQSFEEICAPAITGFKGQVIKKMGDALLAVFKHPLNAAMTALTIQKKIQEHNQYKVETEKFNVRIGLNTGLVIRKSGDVYGDTVNIASRMQTAATPGDILLTQTTYEEIKDYIRCTHLGDIQVKGKKEPITTYSADEILVDINQVMGAGLQEIQDEKGSAEPSPLDRLRESVFTPDFTCPAESKADSKLTKGLISLFQELARGFEEIAKDYHEEYIFKRFLQEQWNELVDTCLAPGQKPAVPKAVVPSRSAEKPPAAKTVSAQAPAKPRPSADKQGAARSKPL